jgi:hypothetical protein
MKYAAASLILLTLLTTWAGVLGVRHSHSIAATLGSLLPAAICLWMTIRVVREHYQTQ